MEHQIRIVCVNKSNTKQIINVILNFLDNCISIMRDIFEGKLDKMSRKRREFSIYRWPGTWSTDDDDTRTACVYVGISVDALNQIDIGVPVAFEQDLEREKWGMRQTK